MRSTFEERVFPEFRFSDILTFLHFVGTWFATFPKRTLQMCKDFGLQPRRKMMRGSQLSFWLE